MIKKLLVSAVALCLGSMMTTAVHAKVIEINRKVVTDAGGFPYEIRKPGSYRLTSNLFVKGNSSAIVTSKPAVTIDLNGFRILGQNSCTFEDGPPRSISCSGPNTSAAISGAHRISNGLISGFGNGIIARNGQALVVEGVTVKNHSTNGINPSGQDLILRNSVVSENGRDGVVGQFSTGTYVVTHNVIEKNGRDGAYLQAGVASDNTIYRNIACGIRSNVGRGAMVVNNYFGENGTGLTGSMSYRSNVFNGNDTHVSGGVNLGQNVCGNALCP
ncbi:MAG TPA: right-handed parallel beta-helix repeat-containing protein [Kiloniellaceae bacterium]|nr:right-handed parallel beta-helix repeat-containing protein [Kiloniellaceae bacterium]